MGRVPSPWLAVAPSQSGLQCDHPVKVSVLRERCNGQLLLCLVELVRLGKRDRLDGSPWNKFAIDVRRSRTPLDSHVRVFGTQTEGAIGHLSDWPSFFCLVNFAPEFEKCGLHTKNLFVPRWRMGNINKWGGPISIKFLEKKLALAKRVVGRMRDLGMIPVLPCFGGNVPRGLQKVYPSVNLTKYPAWNGFNASYSAYMLDPMHPLFQKIGSLFLIEVHSWYLKLCYALFRAW